MSRMLTPKDFYKICRTCQQIKDIMTEFNEDIINTLESFTNITIVNNCSLPNRICEECLEKATDCMKFKKQCEDSEKSLLTILNEIEDKDWILDNLEAKYNEVDVSRPVKDLNIKQEIDEEKYSCNENKLQENLTDCKIPFQEISIKNEYEETYPCDSNFYATERIDATNTLIPNLSQDHLSKSQAKIDWVKNLDPEKCDINKLLCKICEKTLVNISSLARHLGTHDKNRKFLITCNICRKGFSKRGNYKKHLQSHHLQQHKQKARYECDKCSKYFYELNTLSIHLRKSHDVKPLQCTECNKEFIIEKQLNLHLKKHRNEFEHKCSHCGKGYFLMGHLKKHMLTHQKTYLCEVCDKTYKNHKSLKGHNDRYHKSVQLKQDCQICGKTVLRLKSHMLIHNGTRMFECVECKKSFIYRSDLVAHCKRKHRSSDEPPMLNVLCNICGKRKLSNAALRQHIIHAHTTEKTQKCALCDKSFKAKNTLKSHIRYSHNDVRNFKCSICGNGFHTNAILRNHIRTHTGERPFVCLICSRAFGKNSTLTTHMKIHSTAEYDSK